MLLSEPQLSRSSLRASGLSKGRLLSRRLLCVAMKTEGPLRRPGHISDEAGVPHLAVEYRRDQESGWVDSRSKRNISKKEIVAGCPTSRLRCETWVFSYPKSTPPRARITKSKSRLPAAAGSRGGLLSAFNLVTYSVRHK